MRKADRERVEALKEIQKDCCGLESEWGGIMCDSCFPLHIIDKQGKVVEAAEKILTLEMDELIDSIRKLEGDK